MTDLCREFPLDFVWGCATAAAQVEGAAEEDGRGESVWDAFSRQPGRIAGDQTPAVAVDQYHRYREDVELMASLGVTAYRFSIAWPRVFPRGDGEPSPKGLDYYDRLVDELLSRGIEPWPTLYHWDLPQALQEREGGWLSGRTPRLFADYAAHVAGKLSDRVHQFMTTNEFSGFTDVAHYCPGVGGGTSAPGTTVTRRQLAQIRHHALVGHGLALAAVRAAARGPVRVGLAEDATACVPVADTSAHLAAARAAFRLLNAQGLTAVMEGAYPAQYLEGLGSDAPAFTDGEMRTIGAPVDFVGLNMYRPHYIRHAKECPSGFERLPYAPGHPRMDTDWLYVGPEVAYWVPRLASEIWGARPIYITENGCACRDVRRRDGRIDDTDRLMYLRNHLSWAARAVREGVPLAGYFLWSLLDNFEWDSGYTKRFGIVYVNYTTLERTPKLSAEYYREVIRSGRVV